MRSGKTHRGTGAQAPEAHADRRTNCVGIAFRFGDCFSHALSVERGEPLLFVGDDFPQTDVEVGNW